MQTFYNLTPREQFRINGQLSPETTEELLDNAEALLKAEGVSSQVQEALGCYPGEDFLAGLIDSLQTLAKRLRGDNREALLGLVEQAEDLQQCVFNEGDYGRSELREALKTLADAGL